MMEKKLIKIIFMTILIIITIIMASCKNDNKEASSTKENRSQIDNDHNSNPKKSDIEDIVVEELEEKEMVSYREDVLDIYEITYQKSGLLEHFMTNKDDYIQVSDELQAGKSVIEINQNLQELFNKEPGFKGDNTIFYLEHRIINIDDKEIKEIRFTARSFDRIENISYYYGLENSKELSSLLEEYGYCYDESMPMWYYSSAYDFPTRSEQFLGTQYLLLDLYVKNKDLFNDYNNYYKKYYSDDENMDKDQVSMKLTELRQQLEDLNGDLNITSNRIEISTNEMVECIEILSQESFDNEVFDIDSDSVPLSNTLIYNRYIGLRD